MDGESAEAAIHGRLMELPIEKIRVAQRQVRTAVDDQAFEELKSSIEELGLINPVLVRPAEGEGEYELIAGHQRLKACRELGQETIQAKVVEVDNEGALERQLVENLQRTDLSPFDEAAGYRRLAEEFNWTHERIGERYRKAAANVTAAIKVATLPKKFRVEYEKLTKKPSKSVIIEMAAKDTKTRNTLWERIKSGEIETVSQLRVAAGEEASKSQEGETPKRQIVRNRPLKPQEVIYHGRRFAQGLEKVNLDQLAAEVQRNPNKRADVINDLEYLIEHAQDLLAAVRRLQAQAQPQPEIKSPDDVEPDLSQEAGEEAAEDTLAAVESGDTAEAEGRA